MERKMPTEKKKKEAKLSVFSATQNLTIVRSITDWHDHSIGINRGEQILWWVRDRPILYTFSVKKWTKLATVDIESAIEHVHMPPVPLLGRRSDDVERAESNVFFRTNVHSYVRMYRIGLENQQAKRLVKGGSCVHKVLSMEWKQKKEKQVPRDFYSPTEGPTVSFFLILILFYSPIDRRS